MASIDVMVNRPLGTIDRRIFGGFIEHLGRCIYTGVYDEGSPLADDQGFRKDVLDAVRGLAPPQVRWPGGNFVSNYHWTDGIGPVDQRPRKLELAWHTEESNRFGTDEFMAWCQAVGTEPVICLNMGTGTMEEALAWIEYCNGTGNTYWASKRRENGHPEPYNVRMWGLGNEMYGEWQVGHRTAEDYVATAKVWGRAIKRLDPELSLVSCGNQGINDWDQIVIDGLAPIIDYHSLHLYTGSDDYWTNVLAPHYTERMLGLVRELIDRARYRQRINREINVAYDEWNVWFRTDDGQLEERYNLSDTLAVATFLNIFVRRSRTVKVANFAQLVNVIAPIVTSPQGMLLQGIYHPLQLMSRATREITVDTFVKSGAHAHVDPPGQRWRHRVGGLGPFQFLDVAASRDAGARQLTLSVVNRDPERILPTRIQLHTAKATGKMTGHEVNGAHPGVVNTFEQPNEIGVRRFEQRVKGDVIEVSFPPHSFTVLEMDLAER
jgi:alpha-L-arabinofuranosidase